MFYIMLVSILGFGNIAETVYFSEKELSFSTVKGYEVPKIKSCNFIPAPGEPQLPVKAIYFLLPEGTTVKEVKVTNSEFKWLQGEYNIYPSQPPQILSKIPNLKSQIAKFVEPNQKVYKSMNEYPTKLIEFVGTGSMRGYRIAEILVYPLQLIPATKKLKLYTKIDISIELMKQKMSNTKYRNISPEIKKIVKSLVVNPENVGAYYNMPLPAGGYEHVIITKSLLVEHFESLAQWKTSKGIKSVIRTTEWINANYTGRDLQEKIRNFLKIAAQDSGLIWVLLGGDTDHNPMNTVVPSRIAYAMTCEAGGPLDEDSLHSDLYYSDLDGTWDANNNYIFGEMDDSVDLYPDIFVGRAPVRDSSEVQTFVNKTIKYENSPPPGYLDDALFMAEILWANPYTDAAVAKNMIGELFPAEFNIQKLYESLGNENRDSVIGAMNSGRALLNHDGHGWIGYMGIGTDGLGNSDMDALTNGDAQGIFYSIGCWCGAFDYDCIAEHWVRNPNGGGVAFIGNSRYGWGSPGNPGFGYSDKIDEKFFYNLFKNNETHIGITLAHTKMDYIAYSRTENVFRWHQYQLNLLGDPELNIWTDTPDGLLQANYPESLIVGESKFKISVTHNSLPVNEALVCCNKDSEVFETAYTNQAGEAIFTVSPTSSGSLLVTISYPNYYPHKGEVIIFSTGTCPGYYSHTIADSGDNGEINPGELIDLTITLKNYGTEQASGLNALLQINDSYVTLLDSIHNFGDVSAGSTASGEFSFRVDTNCLHKHLISCNLSIPTFDDIDLNFLVQTPCIEYQYYTVDKVLSPGDTSELWITVKNTGGKALNIESKISSPDTNLIILDTLGSLECINADSYGNFSHKIAIKPTCLSPYFAEAILNIETHLPSTLTYSFEDTFLLKIDQETFSFFDDFESDTNWTHGGATDLWMVTQHDYHSSSHSWYCGDTTSWKAKDSVDCWLLSPEFVPMESSSWLSFWCQFDVATYGSSGMYIIIKNGTSEDTIDFIGSGGALDSTYFETYWAKYSYDLSPCSMGVPLQVKFSFVADSTDVVGGFYFDDVRVGELETEPELRIGELFLNDSLGNNDNIVDPGESVFVYLWLINDGTSSLLDVVGHIYCIDSYVTILPYDSLSFGDIFGKRVVEGWFSFETTPSTPSGHYLDFNLNVDGTNVPIGIKTCGTGAEERKTIKNFGLMLYPNPSQSGEILIRYSIGGITAICNSQLTIYDISGRLIKTFVMKSTKVGNHEVVWDTEKLGCGVYFVKFTADNYNTTKKFILLK